jgi:hypothetical protein
MDAWARLGEQTKGLESVVEHSCYENQTDMIQALVQLVQMVHQARVAGCTTNSGCERSVQEEVKGLRADDLWSLWAHGSLLLNQFSYHGLVHEFVHVAYVANQRGLAFLA